MNRRIDASSLETPDRKRRALIGSALVCSVRGASAAVQAGSKPLTIVVPYPPGGISDGLARVLAPHLGAALARPVIVENVSGASGALAARKTLLAEPDGNTLMLASPNDGILAPMTVAAAQFQPEELQLLSAGIVSPVALVARANLPATTVAELVTISRASQGLFVGNVGLGSINHLVADDFGRRTGARLTHVPYRGGAPLMQDMVGGQIDFSFLPLAASIISFIEQGRLQLIGLIGSETISGLPGRLKEGDDLVLKQLRCPSWYSVAVARTVAEPTKRMLHVTIDDALRQADVQAWVRASGAVVRPAQDLQQALVFQAAEIALLRAMVKSAGITPQ